MAEWVKLPVMVVLGAFGSVHTAEAVDIPADEEVTGVPA